MSFTPTRRSVLKAGAATAGVTALSSSALVAQSLRAPSAFAAPRGRLVFIFLRGGQDHLSTVVPYTEAAYFDARPTISIPAESVLDLDGQFGLHPAMTRLHALFGAGRLAVIPGVGNLAGNRSHFSAQDLCEAGATSTPSDAKGWLGRYLSLYPGSNTSIFRATAVSGTTPLSLRGYKSLGVPSIRRFGLNANVEGLSTLLRDSHFGDLAAEKTGIQALDAAIRIAPLAGSNAADKTTRSLADLATLLASNLGIEVATVDITGWDTHHDMGTATTGLMRDLLAGLDTYLGAFQADLDARGLNDVTTVVMTEFGRRVAENGSGGTDHGYGSAMFVMGARAIGGVHGEWAGLNASTIGQRGDVVPTVDFRDVLRDCARGVLGVASPSSLFPGHTYAPLGVVTP